MAGTVEKKVALPIFALTIVLSGCSQTPKDNVKACEIQHEIYTQAMASKGWDLEQTKRFIEMSQEAESIAEPDLAFELDYQTKFLKILADPNTQQGWTPSEEMGNSSKRIGDICRSFGFKFD